MKVVGLLSGGKDSCFNLCHCVRNGHEIVALATLAPPQSTDELDSYMYQTVGHDAVHLVAAAMELPLYRHQITGTALNQAAEYGSRLPSSSSSSGADGQADETSAKDETEDLYQLLMQVKRQHPDVEAVSVGAILSNYQRVRVEHVALRAELSLLPLTYLWQRSQPELYDEMIQAGMTSILIKVAGIGLAERDLGKTLHQMRSKLWKLHDLYGAHVCGEGGEYETLTLDSPLFKKRIEIRETETVVHSDSGFGSVSYLRIKRAELVDKAETAQACGEGLSEVPMPDDLDAQSKRTLHALEGDYTVNGSPGADVQANNLARIQLDSDGKSAGAGRVPSLSKRGRWLSLNNIDGLADGGNASLEDEVVLAFHRLSELLSSHRPALDLSSLTHINLYLSSQSLFPAINAVYKRHFGSAPPTRACIAVEPTTTSARFHLSAVAYDDVSPLTSTSLPQPERKALHVQGRSYWAPANIGPYSQAVTVGQRIWIAGQIGLRAKDLSLPGIQEGLSALEAAKLQSTLAMQHVRRIFEAVLETRVGEGWIEGGVCWIDAEVPVELVRRCWDAQFEAVRTEHVEGNDSDEDDEDDDQGSWLSPRAGRTAPPMLFAKLGSGNLPRSAKVEWQVTAHTGLSVPRDSTPDAAGGDNDDDDDDDETEADLPVVRRRRFGIDDGRQRYAVDHISSQRGRSSFGIVSFPSTSSRSGTMSDEGNEDEDESREWLKAQLSGKAFAVTLLYTNNVDVHTALEGARAMGVTSVADINRVPVKELHTLVARPPAPERTLETVDYALVWHGE